MSLCLRHVISRGALVGWRTSTPLKFLLSHTFRETWRTCRTLFRRYQFFPEMEEMLIEKGRQRTFLYDTKSPDYRDQYMRANAWEAIGKELKIKREFYVSSCDVRVVCPRLKGISPTESMAKWCYSKHWQHGYRGVIIPVLRICWEKPNVRKLFLYSLTYRWVVESVGTVHCLMWVIYCICCIWLHFARELFESSSSETWWSQRFEFNVSHPYVYLD